MNFKSPLRPLRSHTMSAPDTNLIYSGRGETLKPAHRVNLVKLCLSRKSDKPFKEHTKKFWKDVSDLFFEQTSRPYSWQSCRRQMTKWELRPQGQTGTPSPEPATASESFQVDTAGSSNCPGKVVLPPISELYRGNCFCHERRISDSSDDGLLPDLPLHPVRSQVQCTVAGRAPCYNTQYFLTSMDEFEERLRSFTSSLVDQATRRLAVEIAFQNLKDEIWRALDTTSHDRLQDEETNWHVIE